MVNRDPIGTVRRQDNAVGVRVFGGGWLVVWTLFRSHTSQRGYFYTDESESAAYIARGERIGKPSAAEIAMFQGE